MPIQQKQGQQTVGRGERQRGERGQVFKGIELEIRAFKRHTLPEQGRGLHRESPILPLVEGESSCQTLDINGKEVLLVIGQKAELAGRPLERFQIRKKRILYVGALGRIVAAEGKVSADIEDIQLARCHLLL